MIKRKKKNKKSKEPSISQLKKKLEALQKQLVILLYGNDCYTCPQKNLQKMNCQLGHVPWPRSDLGPKAKFDTRFTRIQCFRCNINQGGAGAKAYARMQEEGIDLNAMRAESDAEKGKVVPRKWYEEQIVHFSRKLEELQKTQQISHNYSTKTQFCTAF